MICKGCGIELPEKAKFCQECGTKNEISAAPKQQNMILVCGSCGTIPEEGKKFCLSCGAKLSESGVMKPVEQDGTEQEAAGSDEQNMILVCGSCGTIPEEGKKFCLSCGAKLSESGVMKLVEQDGTEQEGAGSEEQNMILVCGSCGTIPEEGKKFCLSCGAKLSESGIMKPAQAENAEDTKEATGEESSDVKSEDLQSEEGQSVDGQSASATVLVNSEMNHWSYEIPQVLYALDLPFKEVEDNVSYGGGTEYIYGCVRGEFGNGVYTAEDTLKILWPNMQGENVFVKEMTEINGLPALYRQYRYGEQYTHIAVLPYKEETWGFFYAIYVVVPRIKMETLKEEMDNFIFSFKLDEKKIQKKFSERGAARVQADKIWQKNRVERKKPEEENPDAFYFDGSLITVKNSATKVELYIDNSLVDQFKWYSKNPTMLKAENFQFKSGSASIEVYFHFQEQVFKLYINFNGTLYQLGNFKIGWTKIIRESIDDPGRQVK